ncbi:HAD domain-containing protein [Nannocystis bainbridge]|uniref:HAD domain-containing protein n=1 Tax=Nannocystis bainbridge TaxID=2995303 RepID=A0ABT5EB91_9BACT|nr:HAD domain-containing protein [Nannocystis bainbridge]MDC0722056.1 HAD domain-containing protein [Nannocystis bainbridge]
MPPKVIFLDIDGVMNNLGTPGEPERPGLGACFDPHNVAVLNQIVRATGAVVVVSSSWRLSLPLHELRASFAAAGCEAQVVGITPDVDGPRRGREIRAWLDAQSEPPTRYVAIDDQFDMPELPGHLVKTSRFHGLTARELPQVLARLAD